MQYADLKVFTLHLCKHTFKSKNIITKIVDIEIKYSAEFNSAFKD